MNMLPSAIATFSAILKNKGHAVQVFDTTYYAIDFGIDSEGSKEEIGGLVKTFPLYTRLPRSYWKDIKIAESETPEGKKVYNELLSIFRKQYSSVALARD